ncbi:RagB/SusD family nutrient uptake outer membrane protein [uncultured Draconibacterium sp.]|uniref:RagB/SusD family nutrient uptake outer membrane protein n=1 Tax=uncultured Draconibacterium sp. TaxID=1573823 RepID=UPI0029C614C9|nr:RagB/SusD family nutrient uptake outer membrane protein [uncultured Draconibacterium sp.]
MKNILKFLAVFIAITVMGIGCTDLDETLEDRLTKDQVTAANVSDLLTELYKTLNDVDGSGADIVFEHTTDILIAPTRGGDWDDNGAWRALHQHKWDSEHSGIGNRYQTYTAGLFSAIDLLQYETSAQQEAEARFIRALYVFWITDGWGQVPMRDPGAALSEDPYVLSGAEAIDFVISECESIISSLPANDNPWVATQAAAHALLAKAYLSRDVFSSDRQSFSFSSDNMSSVISNCDAIINSGNFALESDYFMNFSVDNENSNEIIFSARNTRGIESGGVQGRYYSTLHYNQKPSGWNGFTTLADFYETFEENDVRRSGEVAAVKAASGLDAGLLYGQQYDENGTALEDRAGNPLFFTKESPIISSGTTLETSGIRIMKYTPDYDNVDSPENDLVHFRYADILLMKAEALLRTGDSAGALVIVNQLRSVRNASELASINEDVLLAERARELYDENWRRNDLIRFGKYLDSWDQKEASDAKYLLFPFSASQIASNPNLVQNPGY